MDGEIKRKLSIALIVLVLFVGIFYQGGKKFGFWGQLGSDEAVTLAAPAGNTLIAAQSKANLSEANLSEAAQSKASLSNPNQIVVHVIGAVAKPGVYTFPVGSRVYQAVEKAGATKEAALSYINLAEPLQDGAQIVVPSKAELAANPVNRVSGSRSSAAASINRTGRTTSNASVSGLINLNTANQSQLETLPGIGPAMAQRIIAYRETNGPFQSVQDIQKVSGIGSKKYKQLASRVRI